MRFVQWGGLFSLSGRQHRVQHSRWFWHLSPSGWREMLRYHLAPVKSFFPSSHQGSCPMVPWFPCSMLTLRQVTHCKKMVFAEQNLSRLLLVLTQHLLWHSVLTSQGYPFGCEGAGDFLLPGTPFPSTTPGNSLLSPSQGARFLYLIQKQVGVGLEDVLCQFLSLPRGPTHLLPGHTLQKHGLGGAEFLWVQAVGDTAVALTLRIVPTHLSDPLKHPGFVHLLQGSSRPSSQGAFSI